MLVPIEKQIEACIHGRKYELVKEYFHNETLSNDDYKKVFNVSKQDVKKYLLSHYQISDLIKTHPSESDGFYALEEGEGKYLVYRQERKVRFDEIKVDSVSDVWNQYIKVELGIL